MSDKYGYCNYCGKYRPLHWNGGYCSQKCYVESGQQETDTQEEADYQSLWYSRTDFFSVVKRTILLGIQWFVIYFLMIWGFQSLEKSPNAILGIMFDVPFFTMVILFFVISLIQNFIANKKGEFTRKVIFYGPQILVVILFIMSIRS